MKNYIIFALFIIITSSCKTSKVFTEQQKSQNKELHLGILITDTQTGKTLYSYQSDKTFVPASNTKIITLYSSLKSLGDSIPSFKYFEKNDTLYVLGTGDPTLLHPDFPESSALKILQKAKHIVISDQNFQQTPYGIGWAWDDYNDYYQTELSSIPIYGNVVRISTLNNQVKPNPGFFEEMLKDTIIHTSRFIRKQWSNEFYFNKDSARSPSFSQEIPFRTGLDLTAALLSEKLGIPVETGRFNVNNTLKTAFSQPVDTVYRKMMQQSDNFLAEQLLLLSGGVYSDTISSRIAIREIRDHLFQDFIGEIRWRDGSGLSRYNLLSPEFIVYVLNKMHKEFPEDRIFSLMSIGGRAGTLRNKYKGTEQPYVFAKTGSMGGVYCESGFLIAKSGRMLTYSVLKNNFTGTVAENGLQTMELINSIRKRF